ncbi:tail fiber assembly protein [Enterobacter hormaechei]|uniref:tail fiber assembly protein n=1 Tax=Enterobacter hormaechei TaxID=158836 RepID=UPI0005F98B2D|nr:tail fiber assembly protein [Enterobacter hormaechei]EKS6305155.1 tail fiber assembly protein [Enterobacter hormaechei]KJX25568.1 phage tail fiber protein [Enterobacter hormaechei subsp. xiangfangensis]MBT1898898.1 tail fiber assembly protein [Enterobacter hormaechei subsp. xiangfangensis]MBW7784589.1 tail fiber assembly protein [Enterobacter hormaechei]MCO0820850.1 tail fiber assembly protein [Enterobacter hormaechei]
MTKYFSPSVLGFYIDGINKNIPNNAVAVSDEVYQQFAGAAWPEGKVIGTDDMGGPVWVHAPPTSVEELIADAEVQKQYLIDQVNEYINSKQWPGKAVLSRLGDEEKEQYNLWLDYLEVLEAVDTSSAPDISWPVPPDSQSS